MQNKRKISSSISILICLILTILSLMHLGYASQTIEISQWTVIPSEVKTYEPMIMHISIYNPDSVDHYYSLSLSETVSGIFHGWGGYLLSTEGHVDAYSYAHVSIVLYPTEAPQGGSVQFYLSLIQDNPNPYPLLLEADEEYKWVSVSKGELEIDIDSLKSNVTSLEERVSSLELDYHSLENQYNDYKQTHRYSDSEFNSLNSSYNSLESSHNSLQDDYNDLKSKYQAAGEPVTIRNLMYIFLITTIVFIVTTGYYAVRKPRAKQVS